MKKMILSAALAVAGLSAMAQDYKKVLEATFLAFDTTRDMNTKVANANKLSLIAKKWDGEWVTHYYAAYSKAQLAFMEQDATKKDAYLDEAENEKDNAVTILTKDNDETYVLAAMIANGRMSVDPMNRWQKYGKIFSDNLSSAKEYNPDNPRMYYLQGTSKYFTPKNFGGGAKAAKPYFDKAKVLFEKENGSDIAHPYWGNRNNEYFLMMCEKQEEKK